MQGTRQCRKELEITNGGSLETVRLCSVGQESQEIRENILGVQHRYLRCAVGKEVFPSDKLVTSSGKGTRQGSTLE